MTKPQRDPAPDGDAQMGRRTALAGLGVTGMAGILAACGRGEAGDARTTTTPAAGPQTRAVSPTPDDTSGSTPAPTPTPEGTPTPTESGDGGDGDQIVLGTPADIPVGGGKVYPDHKVVVTQPDEGTFHGFTAVCTHQGCLVNSVSDGLIHCPCHQSSFRITDGSVDSGPAPSALAAVELDVARNKIALIEG